MRSSARTKGSRMEGAFLGVKDIVAMGRVAGTLARVPFLRGGWWGFVVGAVELLSFADFDRPLDILGFLAGPLLTAEAVTFAARLFLDCVFFSSSLAL